MKRYLAGIFLLFLSTAALAGDSVTDPKRVDGWGTVIGTSAAAYDDGAGVPQRVSSTTPLPVTVAGGSSVPSGPAGTPNAAVVSIQGITNGTPVEVDGKVTDGTAHGTIMPVLVGGTDGTNAQTIATDANGYVKVIVGTGNLATNIAQFGGQNVVTAGVNGTQAVGGNIAHSSATTTNPTPTGGRVFTAPDTTLIANDTSWHVMTTGGALLTTGYGLPETYWTYAAAASGIVNTTTAVQIKGAAGAGLRNYLTTLDIVSDALTNATELAIRDGAAGSVLYRTKITTAGLPQGRSITFNVPLRGTANTLMEVVTLSASGAGAVYVNATGFTAP